MLIFSLSSEPCILLAKTLQCSHNIYNKVNKLTHSSLFTDLFTKTRSAAAAAGIFVCHTLGAHIHESELVLFQEHTRRNQ